MKLIPTKLDGCFLIQNDLYEDKRGCFFEAFNKEKFSKLSGMSIDFVQDNISISKRGVLRGMHYQEAPYHQAKLVTVLHGEILDVVVDLRDNSASYGKHLKFSLSGKDGQSLFIPKGMAHGFLSVSEKVLFGYKCDEYYRPEYEKGIRFNDPDLNIDWGFDQKRIILSDKDKDLPSLKTLAK